jgi:formylglycine-generating enzyme
MQMPPSQSKPTRDNFSGYAPLNVLEQQAMSTTANSRLRLDDLERRICDIAAMQLGIARERISPSDRLIEDLRCDSLDMVEMFMQIEEQLDITFPSDPSCPVYKAVFTRQPFRLADLAELAYLQQGTGKPDRSSWRKRRQTLPSAPACAFSQLHGVWEKRTSETSGLYERLDLNGPAMRYRRRSDGMQCALIPSATAEIGCDAPEGLADERPSHVAKMSSFLIDVEPVSTAAYCRFLNSVGEVGAQVLAEWFVLDDDDDRNEHMLIRENESGWRPVPGAERWPMILAGCPEADAWPRGQKSGENS